MHNLRAAFVAGLAAGMNKALCLVQQGDGPIPLDVRDTVETAERLEDLNDIVAEFAAQVAEAFQEDQIALIAPPPTLLQTLDLGASSAENEMRTLQGYYLTTEAFLKSLRGEAHLVVGRKGSGKSAIFLQIRDRERSRDPAKNIVLDLKPEGYKLVKFKETVLTFMREGTAQHTLTAFWNYILLLEMASGVSAGGSVTYTVTVTNNDPITAASDVTLSVAPSAGVTSNGTSYSSSQGTCDPASTSGCWESRRDPIRDGDGHRCAAGARNMACNLSR